MVPAQIGTGPDRFDRTGSHRLSEPCGHHEHTATSQQGRSFGTATRLLPTLPLRLPLSTRSVRAPPSPSTLPCPTAARPPLPSHDFSVLSLGLGLPFIAATRGRVALPVVRRATGASPATNIRQRYACLFPSLPLLLREIKQPNPNI